MNERLKDQQEHWLYKEALERFEGVQQAQMVKAAKKYPEPLEPATWTPEELVTHAMEELVDQAHYLIGISHKFRQLQEENDRLRGEDNGVVLISGTKAEKLHDALSELIRMRNVQQVPEVKATLDIIIEAVKGQ